MRGWKSREDRFKARLVSCTTRRSSVELHYFELGEITDRSLARCAADALRNDEPRGTAFSQDKPFAYIIGKKRTRKYETYGAPVDLMLYYRKQSPPLLPHFAELLATSSAELGDLVIGGPFRRVWIFDFANKRVLWRSPATTTDAFPVTNPKTSRSSLGIRRDCIKPLVTLSFIVMMMAAASVAKEKDRIWKTGKVLDSQSAKTFVQTGSSTQSSATATATYGGTATASGTSETQVHNMAIQDTQLMIVADDFLYVVNDEVQKGMGLNGSLARVIINRKHGCHVIINDPVQYSQDKAKLYVKDVDGKECKMEIVRQERVVQPLLPPKP